MTEVHDIPRRLLKPRLTTPETAEYLALVHGVKISASTLRKWRVYGQGPLSEKVAGGVYYKPAAIDEWVNETSTGQVASTSETKKQPCQAA